MIYSEMPAHQTKTRTSQDVLKLQRTIGTIGKSQEQQDPLNIVEKLAVEFEKVAVAKRTLTWQIAQWKEWKAMRYRFHFSDLEIAAEAEASDCDFVFRDGLGNRWGQKPTGPNRKRTLWVASDD